MDSYRLGGKVAVITGGAGLLGVMHAECVAEAGGIPVIADIDAARAEAVASSIEKQYGTKAMAAKVDITDRADVERLLDEIIDRFGRVDILINNAANNPKVEGHGDESWGRLENFPLDVWAQDIAVGLTGALIMSQVFGSAMAARGGGVILNISSDLGVIAPDQRLYKKDGLPPERQPVKPVSYSVVKHGLLGLTKYLATYWVEQNVRANAISPGGVFNNQPEEFLDKVNSRIPMGRLARKDEYKGAVLFLISDASSYMNGANLIIDGGRSCW